MEWTPGSVWESYAFQMNDDSPLPWSLIGFKEMTLLLSNHKMTVWAPYFQRKSKIRDLAIHVFCLNSDNLQSFISCAHHEAKLHTPWKYFNQQQLTQLLVKSQNKADDLCIKVCAISESSRVYILTSLSASQL